MQNIKDLWKVSMLRVSFVSLHNKGLSNNYNHLFRYNSNSLFIKSGIYEIELNFENNMLNYEIWFKEDNIHRENGLPSITNYIIKNNEGKAYTTNLNEDIIIEDYHRLEISFHEESNLKKEIRIDFKSFLPTYEYEEITKGNMSVRKYTYFYHESMRKKQWSDITNNTENGIIKNTYSYGSDITEDDIKKYHITDILSYI